MTDNGKTNNETLESVITLLVMCELDYKIELRKKIAKDLTSSIKQYLVRVIDKIETKTINKFRSQKKTAYEIIIYDMGVRKVIEDLKKEVLK